MTTLRSCALFAAALAAPQVLPAQARLGVSVNDVVLVSTVSPGSPAAAAGLQPGDLILEVDGKPVSRASDLQAVLKAASAGKPLPLRIYRAGRNISLTAPQAAQPAAPAPVAPTAGSERGKFTLKQFEGFDFNRRQVVESKANVDFTLTWQLRVGVVTYLGSPKIKYFGETKPNLSQITKAEIETWKDYVLGVGRGYHVIKTFSNKYYLVSVDSFQDLGKAPAYWVVNFSYERIEPR